MSRYRDPQLQVSEKNYFCLINNQTFAITVIRWPDIQR